MPSILVAENNPALADLYRIWLSRSGYSVALAANGKEALELASQSRFDLMIFDQHMPQMTGSKSLQLIRERSLNRNSPALFCTSRFDDAEVSDLRTELGVSQVVKKPFSLSEIIKLVQDLTQEMA